MNGKAPSVLFGASPSSLWEPWGALPARWCGGHAFACPRGVGLAVFPVVTCVVALVVCASVPQCGFRRPGLPALVAHRPLA